MTSAAFRDSGDGCSGLLAVDGRFYCGGSLGLFYELLLDRGDSEMHDFLTPSPICALAYSSKQKQLAHAAGESVSFRRMADWEEVQSFAVRRTLAVTHLAFTRDEELLLIASREPDIQVYSMREQRVVDKVSSHSAGVRFFVLSADDRFLAYLDDNGDVHIVELERETALLSLSSPLSGKDLVHTSSSLVAKAVARDPSSGWKMCWVPATSALLVPSVKGAVVALQRNAAGWEESFLLGDATQQLEHAEAADVLLVECCVTQRLLVTADSQRCVLLWRLGTPLSHCQPLRKIDCPLTPFDVVFATPQQLLVLGLDSFVALPFGVLEEKPAAVAEVVATKTVPATLPRLQRLAKTSAGATSGADNDDNDQLSLSHAPRAKAMFDVQSEDEQEALAEEDEELFAAAPAAAVAAASPSLVQLQPLLCGNATDWDAQQRRYLLWTQLGSVVQRQENSVEWRVEVRFTNQQQQRHVALTDTQHFRLAALSNDGLALVYDVSSVDSDADDGGAASVLYFHAFKAAQTQGAADNFTVALPASERVLLMASGRGWVAVATTAQLVRVFSCAGVELLLWAAPAHLFAMQGCDNLLALLYHRAAPCEHQLQAALDLYRVHAPHPTAPTPTATQLLVRDLALPLRPRCRVNWLGFDTDRGRVALMDSAGQLLLLMRVCAHWHWLPVLDSHQVRKAEDHKFWPVCVRQDKLVYVLLMGESRPAVHPQPITSAKALRIPGCVSENNELLWKETQLQSSVSDAASAQEVQEMEEGVEKLLLKQFQGACQQQKLVLATHYALRMHSLKALQLAVAVANHFGRAALAQFIDQLLQLRTAEQQQSSVLAATQETMAVEDTGVCGEVPPHDQENFYPDAQQEMFDDRPDTDDAATAGGLLSRKAQRLQHQHRSQQRSGPDHNQSPDPLDFDDGEGQSQAHLLSQHSKPVNPFALSHQTPSKRKIIGLQERMQELRSVSPTPKKAALKRSSTFSEKARNSRLHDKGIL